MLEQFENEFEKEEMIITVLFKEGCGGACVLEKNWLKPSATFVACIYNDGDDVIKKDGRIEWLIKEDKNRKGFGYDFEQYGIYKLRVRKCIQKELEAYQMPVMNNRYMLLEILEKNAKNAKLEDIKEYLMRPVYIETKYAKFELERSFSWFSAEVAFGDYEVNVSLETDEDDGETANGALGAFNNIADRFEEFDNCNKECAAEYLLELANDWLADDDREDKPEKITKEMFMNAIDISEMTISPDGSMTVYYNDGDMFWGHVILVEIEADGSYSDASIAG